MARITLTSQDDTSPEIVEVFQEIISKAGKVPAPYRAFARHAHILQANWNKTKNVLGKGNFPIDFKESIALAVSTKNGCEFCIDIHEKNLRKQGYSDDEIQKIARAESNDSRKQAALEFCVKATSEPHSITNEEFQSLQEEHGYSEEDIVEMLTVMEMYTGYNKIITALKIEIDD